MDLPLPCPLEAGWQLVRTIRLPRMLADGRPLGGFSAAAYQPKQDRLWLLSDAPIGHLVPWGGLAMSTDWRATNTAGWWRWIRPRLVRRR